MNRILLYLSLLLLPVLVMARGEKSYILHYPSVDQHGDTITLSGKVFVPQEGQRQDIILLPHFTISANYEVPSQTTPIEARFLCDKHILIMPDYIGYGASVDRVHPYLRGDLAAQNCVDMLIAAQHLLDSLNVQSANDSVLLVGFSQGAATAIWTLHLMETQYPHIPVRHCYLGSGPYDVATTYDVAIGQDKTGMPVVIPMLIMGTSAAYDLHLRREDFFSPALDAHYDEWVTSKRHGIINTMIRMPNKHISHWMTAAGRDKNTSEARRMYEGFLRSSFVHIPTDSSTVGGDTICLDWRPRTPIFLMHSTTDDIVPFENARHLQQCLDIDDYDFGDYGGHIQSLLRFFRMLKKKL